MLGEGLGLWQTGPLQINPAAVGRCLFFGNAWWEEKKLIPMPEVTTMNSLMLLHAV